MLPLSFCIEAPKQGKKILIVDDEPDIIDILTSFIKFSHGGVYGIFQAGDGEKALDIVKNEKPDLVFLDLQLPLMNGFEVCRHIKTDKNLAHIPIIIISAYNSEENIAKSMTLGANMFLEKPLTLKKILGAIEEFLPK